MKKLNNYENEYYFFIGTEAELIKLFPVLREFSKKKLQYKIIASGQNNITKSKLLKYIYPKKINILLSQEEIKQTPLGLFSWFAKTIVKSLWFLKQEFKNKKNIILIIHGDTVSTVMGAFVGKVFGLKIAHIEAGLRSFNFFHPFPEELDRIIASQFADIYFCPNSWAMGNLKMKKGLKVNTYQNTLYDSLQFILKQKIISPFLQRIKKEKYFVFITHRQENILNRERTQLFLDELEKISHQMKGVFVLHALTKKQLQDWNLLSRIQRNKQIILSDRLDYGEFMRLLKGSEFIITDGGSNQEEAYYMGKPCLVLRSVTERIEGLKTNVKLSKYEPQAIPNFVAEYNKADFKPLHVKVRPSEIIANYFSSL